MTAGAADPPPPGPGTSGARDTGVLAAATTQAREAIEVVYAARLQPPASPTRAARVAFGAGLPLAILATVLAEPAARRRYLRVCGVQAAVTLLAGVLFFVNVGWTGRGLAFWSSLYATLVAFEWIVIALSRQHHDAISRDAALLTGVPPEDPPLTPRVCVDLRWIGKRIKRHIRGMKVLLAGTIALTLLLAVPVLGQQLYAVATTLWAAYWLVVLVTAKSAHAWREEGTAPAPWFVRAWDRLTTSVPGFRWWLPRAYGRFLRGFTASMFSPAARWERSPWELCGVALMRVLGGLPGMYMFLRPLIPVASQHLLIAQDRQQ